MTGCTSCLHAEGIVLLSSRVQLSIRSFVLPYCDVAYIKSVDLGTRVRATQSEDACAWICFPVLACTGMHAPGPWLYLGPTNPRSMHHVVKTIQLRWMLDRYSPVFSSLSSMHFSSHR